MILFADEGELVEKYRRLTDEGRARISSQIECELRIDAEAVAKRNEKQRRGIHEAKKLAYISDDPRRITLQIWTPYIHSGRHRTLQQMKLLLS